MNLTMLLDMAVDGFGDRVLVGRREAGLTAGGLRAFAVGGARVARDADADAIVYLGANGPAFHVALFAAAYAGIPLVPVNYRLGEGQLEQLLANHPGACVVADGPAAGGAAVAGRDRPWWGLDGRPRPLAVWQGKSWAGSLGAAIAGPCRGT
jgi:acyl-CoA synthetase (AMP-forming)/AMP-acid ligase II